MKTARQLGITSKELDVLMDVRNKLCSGEYKHVVINMLGTSMDDTCRTGFNMRIWDCGTACCIGGWMNRECYEWGPKHSPKHSSALQRLFYPDLDPNKWSSLSTCDAVAAIDNFVETGDPKWAEVAKQS